MADESQRERVTREVREDLLKTEEQLLIDIHDESVTSPQPSVISAPITRTLARFASLLVVLSRKAEESSKRLEGHTRILKALTWTLLFIGAVTLVLAAIQVRFLFHPPK